jgi:hypothetical protein
MRGRGRFQGHVQKGAAVKVAWRREPPSRSHSPALTRRTYATAKLVMATAAKLVMEQSRCRGERWMRVVVEGGPRRQSTDTVVTIVHHAA